MTVLLTLIHVVVCVFLILVVLLQTGKGADIAAAFGGASQTAFGARGATTFLQKMTTGSAILFMFTSLGLVLLSSGPTGSVMDAAPATQAPAGGPAAPAPVAPTAPPGVTPAAPAPSGTGAPEAPSQPPAESGAPAQPGTEAPPSGAGQSTPAGSPAPSSGGI